jgi:hypothetical protein
VLNRVYLFTSVFIVAFYGWVAFTGQEFGHPAREVLPADVRHSPGGYRTFAFWHAGYRGGK